MHRTALSHLLAVLLLLAAAVPAAAQGEKPLYKIGLLLGDQKDRKLDASVLNAATDAFVASRRFTTVERSQLDKVLTEKDLQGFLGKGNQALSDLLGLDFIGLVGYVIEERRLPERPPEPNFVIDVRLVEVKTGQVVVTINSDRPDLLRPPATAREAGQLLFKSVREAFPPFGYIVRITGKEATVDLGSEAGLQDGDVLEVVRAGEQIIHPVTGEALPAEMLVVGELKVVSTSPVMSRCRLKSGDGAIKDTVRLKGRSQLMKKMFEKLPWLRLPASGD
jgi:hypothetical protein